MKLARHLPRRTLAIAAAVLAVAAVPGALASLAYDRAAILDGEIWRVATAHLVHGSGNHLLWNLLGLLGVGLLFEEALRQRLWSVLAAAALAVGLGLLVLDPGLAGYCGLSGVLNGVWICGAMSAARAERRRGRPLLAWAYLGCILADLAKTAVEGLTGQPLFTDPSSLNGPPVPLAHALGGFGGVIGLGTGFLLRRKKGARMGTGTGLAHDSGTATVAGALSSMVSTVPAGSIRRAAGDHQMGNRIDKTRLLHRIRRKPRARSLGLLEIVAQHYLPTRLRLSAGARGRLTHRICLLTGAS